MNTADLKALVAEYNEGVIRELNDLRRRLKIAEDKVEYLAGTKPAKHFVASSTRSVTYEGDGVIAVFDSGYRYEFKLLKSQTNTKVDDVCALILIALENNCGCIKAAAACTLLDYDVTYDGYKAV
jgi:hypothetical protein